MSVEKTRVPLLREEGTTITQHGVSSEKRAAGGVGVLTSLAAGAAAGAIAKTTIAPLDRCKINFQVSATPYSWAAALRFLRDAVRAEGWAALWRGNSATMARIVPYAAVQFAAHEQWKRLLGVDTGAGGRAAPLRLLLAGSLAGVTSQSATYPLDVARARMAVAARPVGSLRAVLAGILREEGAASLYRGYSATVLGVVPYAGVSFFTYDTLKQAHRERTGREPSGAVKLAMGGAAGALAQTASYPLDIVRRRMQTAARRADRTYPYPTVRAALALVWRAEGWRGFFKGLSMNWVKGPIAVGVSFTTYDFIKSALAGLSPP
ncbi:mitochondrial coenzyme A transporter SLC25A42 [Aricia agestis]|uniref:mitochondrial coenzyme A transporter SLC25A42 n=1 Tax=Aricia agestis TaxID=91739 RepID=UPI001C208136|nr:mitochondrial coenzyme A transporter SLC25A42 [Aricia agestis]XP_041983670.1 mitochondrial coenzyme A transporter SLC25A42 [Aricia agestis]XP_041983671.1 mitochondrial coenzyme A transporter SLC25A42 [Aricia agestis]